eukprot:CAMPEP_0168188352 /NCGR_PEP_ID=MMETSP0139_2-20121125/15590_1 /TAXON_ID=44445 /ORGANISM="Pseudo-nitzschia australis, Strain 10249 10 AB" /LENGTH=358 /DNA_ID=CAMNT_0008110761 /DNA_START=1152 /DNA_END=2228 /DNA_ORIENTATION=+
MAFYFPQDLHACAIEEGPNNNTDSSHRRNRHINRCNHSHFLAQRLNNRACTFISKGNNNDAISDLSIALDLTKAILSAKEHLHSCQCKDCMFGSRLWVAIDGEQEQGGDYDVQGSSKRSSIFSNTDVNIDINFDHDESDVGYVEEQAEVQVQDDAEVGVGNGGDDCCRQRLSHPFPASFTVKEQRFSQDNEDHGFIYSRPIRVNQRSIDEGHYMGVTLPIIALFNLAIAHHLKAVTLSKTAHGALESWETMQQASKLYQLSYELQTNHSLQQPNNGDFNWNDRLVSLRFMMLVTNNLGEIHRLAGNTAKRDMCLQHMWSAMMFMFHNCERVVLTKDELDGLFNNLSTIVAPQHCAAAA